MSATLGCRAEGGCAYDYDSADMQQARCMLCRQRGHFCCQSTARLPGPKRSCYNCGDRDHTGEECWRVSSRCYGCPAGLKLIGLDCCVRDAWLPICSAPRGVWFPACIDRLLKHSQVC